MYETIASAKNPCLGGHESYNFGRFFLGHLYYRFVPRSKEDNFTKFIFLFTKVIKIYNFLSPYPTDAT